MKLAAGTAAGTVRAMLAGERLQAQGEIVLRDVAFSDASGLHAGDAVGGRIAFSASAQGGAWRWTTDATWSEGEAYWDPVYTKAGYHLAADGTFRDGIVDIFQATLAAPDVGEVRARCDRPRRAGDRARERRDRGAAGAAAVRALPQAARRRHRARRAAHRRAGAGELSPCAQGA